MKFINYVADDDRPSPLNLGIGRVVFGLYAMWKFGTQVDWTTLRTWPVRITDFTAFLVPPEQLQWVIQVEFWIVLVLLVLFTVGYRIGLSGFFASLLIAHMAGAMYTISNSGTTETFVPVSLLLMIFAVYRSDVVLSLDRFREQRTASLDRLTTQLEADARQAYHLSPLKWALVLAGIIYFLSGVSKVLGGSVVEWASAASMNRFMQRTIVRGYENPLLEPLVSYPILSDIAAIGSIVLEVGFLPAIVAGLGISLFVVGFFVFHAAIAIALTPFFFDQYVLLLLFFSWDSLHHRLSTATHVDVVYDDRCHFCTRVLLQVDYWDLRDGLAFHPATEVPEGLDGERHDFENAMFAFVDGEAYRGYHAFRAMFAQLGFLRPVAFLMGVPGVRQVGERVYGYVAANRSRYFTCRPADED